MRTDSLELCGGWHCTGKFRRNVQTGRMRVLAQVRLGMAVVGRNVVVGRSLSGIAHIGNGREGGAMCPTQAWYM